MSRIKFFTDHVYSAFDFIEFCKNAWNQKCVSNCRRLRFYWNWCGTNNCCCSGLYTWRRVESQPSVHHPSSAQWLSWHCQRVQLHGIAESRRISYFSSLSDDSVFGGLTMVVAAVRIPDVVPGATFVQGNALSTAIFFPQLHLPIEASLVLRSIVAENRSQSDMRILWAHGWSRFSNWLFRVYDSRSYILASRMQHVQLNDWYISIFWRSLRQSSPRIQTTE